jgi:serine/threonine protein kinase
MVDPQASQFWRFALKSGLLTEAQLRACWEQIPEEKRTPDAIDRRLARRAVDAGMITVWQAQQLLTGRANDFKIDRYLLLELIGQGGMGRVYLAKDTRLGRRVAIKVLSKERTSNPRAITRFQREAKVGAQLQHENLVRIYDEGEAAGIRYLVMEHIDGKNVAQLIGERGSVAWPEAARLTRQIALGLEHAQQKGLIHRDVNPANILVTREGIAPCSPMSWETFLPSMCSITR